MEILDNSGETVRQYYDFTKTLTRNYVSWVLCFAIATGAEEQNHESRTELEAIGKNRKQVPTTVEVAKLAQTVHQPQWICRLI